MAPLAVAAASLWGWVAIAKSLPESLWLDELHSVWCATGTSGDVFDRAALGNQLSPYFWLLRSVSQTFSNRGETAEAVWRAPSVCAWLGVIVLCGWALARVARRGGGSSRPLALLGLALLVLDRLQIFYATEARPYALVALAILGAWLSLSAWSRRWFPPAGAAAGPRWHVRLWLAWCLLNLAACWLQPTAILAVASQYAFLGCLWLAGRRSGRNGGGFWPLGLGGLALGVGMLPALQVLRPVWEHRQRWAAFASGTQPSDVLLLLPLSAYLGPLAIAALLHWVLGLYRGDADGPAQQVECEGDTQVREQEQRREWWMWLLAWTLPCLIVYGLTASGIAPLMHRRYVFHAAAPLMLWTASSVVGLRGRGLRCGAFLAMMATLLVQQGSAQAWREGGWPAAVRGEDWRGAVGWINSQTSSQQPVVVLCCSNLIEGAGPIPQSPAMREYLTLPLQSIYRVHAASRLVPLANEPTSWSGSLAAETAEQPVERVWLVVRCSAAGLERRLQASGLTAGERRDFGGVQVARDVGFNKMP